MQEISRLTDFASHYEGDFMKAIIGHTVQTAETERSHKRRELDKLTVRDKELDALFKRIYEDNTNGKLSDERFVFTAIK